MQLATGCLQSKTKGFSILHFNQKRKSVITRGEGSAVLWCVGDSSGNAGLGKLYNDIDLDKPGDIGELTATSGNLLPVFL